ncbi:hypothetical protein F4778DRAFT_786126 [Xylariomycetidae sp. FL2044]|nr:hypothetical protein F4778DRAFT_786126 [Xylariomycetidae sp. FL2044]
MLERTAASLEPCGFQRVLPGPRTKSFRTTRHLHTAFWQHGAGDIELTSAWQALVHAPVDSNIDSPPEENKTALGASTFLLDFLYPTGAVALMRRINQALPDRSETLRYARSITNVGPRLYTSSSRLSRARDAKSESAQGQNVQASGSLDIAPETNEMVSTEDRVAAQDPIPASDLAGEEGHDDHDGRLNELLETDHVENADRLWYHFKALDAQSQDNHLNRVLVFLSKTGRVSDSWKVSELFQRLGPSRWDSYTFVAGITAELNLQNATEALESFVLGLDRKKIDTASRVDALDSLLAYALRLPTYDYLMDVWNHYAKMATIWDFQDITPRLTLVATVPGLAQKVLGLRNYFAERLQELQDTEPTREAVEALQRILVRRALESCVDDEAIPLLNITKDPLAFEGFLRTSVERRRKKLATDVYQAYRELPDVTPSRYVLYEMFQVYTTLGGPKWRISAGIELLWGDWHKYHTEPTIRAFQRYLAFYASEGDKVRVHELWIRFIELYGSSGSFPVLQNHDTFAHLLQVHAVLGEVDEVERIFGDMKTKFGLKPNAHCWNILLNAYVKADDYDGAIKVFERIRASGLTDNYSYGTLMKMAGDRGDLGFTVDLYRRARKHKVTVNDTVLIALIDAYCQNDYFHEAEDVCNRALSKGIVSTRMWNKLLHYHARRRDLAAINKVLNTMADRHVPYNEYTYQQLLLGLSLCRQSHHAVHLLAVALKDKVFEVGPEHFNIVMGALIKTGEPGLVMRLDKLMAEFGFSRSASTLFRLSQALGQYRLLKPAERKRKTATQWLGEALRTFYRIYGLGKRRGDETVPATGKPHRNSSGVLSNSVETYHFNTMIYIFVQLKDFVRSKELLDLYQYVYQGDDDDAAKLPAVMLSSIMRADLYDKDFQRVPAVWRVLFNTAKREARSADYNPNLPHTPKISPKHRYVLADGLRIMQEYLLIREDPSGLQDLVRQVRQEGFEIDSKNWNYHVQALVQLKRYKEAFRVCEKVLMPNWTGWFVVRTKENVRNKIPLDVRRKGSTPRYLRPIATTLYHLAQGYMELDRLSPWSAEAAAMMQDIDAEYTMSVRAIKSMIRLRSNLENMIFGAGESMEALDTANEESEDDGNIMGVGDEGGTLCLSSALQPADIEAFKDTEYTYFWTPSLEPMYAWNRARILKRFSDPGTQQFKVVDDTTGRIVAWAKWDPPPRMRGLEKGFVVWDTEGRAREVGEGVAGKKDKGGGGEIRKGEEEEEEAGSLAYPEGANEKLADEFFSGLKSMEEKWDAGQRLCLTHLCTAPGYQGRGIGAALVTSVLELADAEGVPAYLESLRLPTPLYERLGFICVDKLEFDLQSRVGLRGSAVINVMLREPRAAGSSV